MVVRRNEHLSLVDIDPPRYTLKKKVIVFISRTRNSNTHKCGRGNLFLCWTSTNGHRKPPGSPLDPERNQRHCDGLATNHAPPSDGLHSIGDHATAVPAPLHGTALWFSQSRSALGIGEILPAKLSTSATERYRKNFLSPKASSLNGLRTVPIQVSLL